MFSGSREKIRQFRLPRVLPLVIGFFLILVSVSACWVIRDYLGIKAKIPQLKALERENALHRERFIKMTEQIHTVKTKIAELRALDEKLRVMADLEAPADDVKSGGMGGSVPSLLDPGETAKKIDGDFIQKMHQTLDKLHSAAEFSKQNKVNLHQFLENQKRVLASIPSIWPAKGWLSSRFGQRTSPFTGKEEFHEGIDISARMSTPIVVTADGVVAFSGREQGYGRVIKIDHGHGLSSKYAHLQKPLVKQGQRVKRGESIGLVGNTGKTTGAHLHYEVHVDGVPVNPLRYIFN
ncbi:MAG: peptidoglycan DD-metalloendopeptidase family protein [Thermodesulfobacteriota bacterium]